MNRDSTKADYAQRIIRVIDYIYDNLDGDLSADTLASVANFSTHHWHRIFHAMTGNTVAETVRRLRLHRAAADLMLPNHSIEAAARRAGYGSVEAFTRAFRAAYGEPPGSFRSNRLAKYSVEFIQPEGYGMPNVEIRTIKPIKLCALPHRGNYHEIGRTFEKLGVQAGPAGLMGPSTRFIGVYYDDPDEVPVNELRSAAGLTVEDATVPQHGAFEAITLEGGRHAVLQHVGPYADLPQSYQWLYGVWLPECGEEAADQPPFEVYLNDPASTPPAELLTEIHLPLL